MEGLAATRSAQPVRTVEKACETCGHSYLFPWREHWQTRKLCNDCVKAKNKAQAATPTHNSNQYVMSVLELCQELNISERELERRAKVPHSTWMRIKRTPNARVLRDTDARFRSVLGERLATADFDNARRRYKGLQNLRIYGHRARRKAAQQRAAKTRKLQNPHVSQAHKEAISVAARDRHRRRPELGHRLGEFQQSFAGRALTALRLKLAWWSMTERRNPSPRPLPTTRAEIPQRHVIRSWANEYAVQRGVDQADVLDVWQPWLEKIGLWSRAGRQRAQDRYRLVTRLMATCRLTPTGKLPRGFWAEAARRVEAQEGAGSPDSEALRNWYAKERWITGASRTRTIRKSSPS